MGCAQHAALLQRAQVSSRPRRLSLPTTCLKFLFVQPFYLCSQARIEQAEAGGCPEGLVAEAKHQLHRLLLAEVRAELEAGECSSPLTLSFIFAILWCCLPSRCTACRWPRSGRNWKQVRQAPANLSSVAGPRTASIYVCQLKATRCTASAVPGRAPEHPPSTHVLLPPLPFLQCSS